MCVRTPSPESRRSSLPSSGQWSPASPNAAEYLYVVAAIKDLAGVLPALISPLHADGTVDEAGVERLVEHVIGGGVTGLLALGSTGETASLPLPSDW